MPDGMTPVAVDYDGLIPNNVSLNDDMRVRKALESWHPGYIDWWKDAGPDGFQESLVLSAHRDRGGSEGLGQVRLCEDARIQMGRSTGAGPCQTARFRSANIRGSRRGRRCRANIAPCCAA